MKHLNLYILLNLEYITLIIKCKCMVFTVYIKPRLLIIKVTKVIQSRAAQNIYLRAACLLVFFHFNTESTDPIY